MSITLTLVPALSVADDVARQMVEGREVGNYRIGMTPVEIEKAAMVIDPAFVAIRRRIFVMFAARDGIPSALAHEEFDRLQSVGGDTAKYLRVQRTGSKFPLNRSEKESLALTFDNAGNHASFEMYHD